MMTSAEAQSYRLPLLITEMIIFRDGYGYYVCPRCHVTLDREFVNYCDRCGQKLGWAKYKKVKYIYR